MMSEYIGNELSNEGFIIDNMYRHTSTSYEENVHVLKQPTLGESTYYIY